MSVSSGDFLCIQPTELQFPFELRRPSSAYLYLTNKTTDENVAFRILTTNWKLFYAKPTRGIIPPGTTFRITVVMDAQTEAPQCIDTFLIQSFIAPKDATEKDITVEMFEKESGNVVKEVMLKGIYVPVESPVPEVYQESYGGTCVPEESPLFEVYQESYGGTCVPEESPVPEVYQESYLLDAITSNDAQQNPHYTGLRRRHIHRIQQI